MGQWTKESIGMEVLRPIALERLKNHEQKARIWSSELEAWGFFSGSVSEDDTFLLWCAITPGDRIAFDGITNGNLDIRTVIGIWKKTLATKSIWTLKMINQSCQLLDISIEETVLFHSAWKSF